MAGIAWDGQRDQPPGACASARRAIREASARPPPPIMLCDGTTRIFDTTPLGQLATPATCRCPTPRWGHARGAGARWPQLLRGHHMVWLGGDHSITLPLLRAYRASAGPSRWR
jgi:agmatinase